MSEASQATRVSYNGWGGISVLQHLSYKPSVAQKPSETTSEGLNLKFS